MSTHYLLLEAFRSIKDKNALAWSVLDTKSELAVTSAIAVSANRRAESRIAYVEYPPRIDLVLKEPSGKLAHAYQAKAMYLNDFQPAHIKTCNPYMGAHFDRDLERLPVICSRLSHSSKLGCDVRGAGLFYLHEVSDSSKQLKYRRPAIALQIALDAIEQFAPRGRRVALESIDCEVADGVAVRIHLAVFDLAVISARDPGAECVIA